MIMIMIIMIMAMENPRQPPKHIRNVFRETTQRSSSFDGWKLLRYTKQNEPSSAKIKNIKQFTFLHQPAQLTVTNNFAALFSRALTLVSVASVACPLNRTWGGSHTYAGIFPSACTLYIPYITYLPLSRSYTTKANRTNICTQLTDLN